METITCLFAFVTFLAVISLTVAATDDEKRRIDCYPEAPYSFGAPIDGSCRQRNCIFQSAGSPGAPWCFFPQESYGYTMFNVSTLSNGYKVYLTRLTKYTSPFPDPIDNLILDVLYLNSKVLHLKIYDAKNKRYEVPIEFNDITDSNTNKDNSDFSFTFENRNTDSVFIFKVIRKSTGTILFDTSLGGFVFCDQFIQIATYLPTASNLYGLGENNHASLTHDMNYRTWGKYLNVTIYLF